MTMHELCLLQAQSVEGIPREELKQLSDIYLDVAASQNERVLSFIEQAGNPYCFLCGKTPVKLCFAENGKSMHQALENILRHRQQS